MSDSKSLDTFKALVDDALRNTARAVVVCDDGSGDLTGEIAGALGAVVKHRRNRG